MILNLENEIDKKIFEIFPAKTIENIKPEIVGNFGMNLVVAQDSNITFKMYYAQNYSEQLYREHKQNIPVINFLKDRGMLDVFEVVHDKDNDECTRFNVKLKCCSNSNILALFEWLEQNVEFVGKYKDEILKLSKIGNIEGSNYEYASLFFIGFVCDVKNNIKSFKCYFLNEIKPDEYYIDFLKNSGVKEFQELLPIVINLLPKNENRLWMEGIDYNNNCSEKHKIYINFSQDIYDKLIYTIPNISLIEDKLKLIDKWKNIHQEFFCDGFAIGKNSKNDLTINIYFRFKK